MNKMLRGGELGKIVILSFEKSEEHFLYEILSSVRKRTKEYQIRDCILENDIL